MTDADVDLSDVPELEESFFREAELRLPARTQPISMRVDPDLVAWFKGQGKGYQTRINAVLRMYVEAHRSGRRGGSVSKRAQRAAGRYR